MKQTIINITQTKGNKYGSTNKRRTLEVRSASLHPWGHKNEELLHSLSKNDEGTKETSMDVTKNIYQTHIIQRSNIMKSSLGKTFVSRSLYALLTIALIAAMAMGQGNLIIGGTPTFTGAGTITVTHDIKNTGVAGVTAISGIVIMNGAGSQAIGIATNGAINFSTLNVAPTVVATTTLNVASTVSTAVNIGTVPTAATLAVGTNTLTITGTSAFLNAAGALTTAAGSNVTFNSPAAGQVVLGGFTYAGALTLSGGALATKSISTAITVGGIFDASAASTLTVSAPLTLGTTGTFAALINSALIKNGSGLASFGAVTNNVGGIIDGTVGAGALTFNSTVANAGGTIKGGAALATFSGLLTQTATGNLIGGAGGLTLTAGLLNTLGTITLAGGQSMSVSGGQFTQTAGALTFPATSTVTYGALATQIVDMSYGNLTLNADAKTMTLTAGRTVSNNLILGAGAATTVNGPFDLTVGGNISLGANLTKSAASVLFTAGTSNVIGTGFEIVGSVTRTHTFIVSTPYTFNNASMIMTPTVVGTLASYTINSSPGTNPTNGVAGNSVQRKYTESYSPVTPGFTATLQLAYLTSEFSGTVGKLKDFQNGIAKANKLGGVYTRASLNGFDYVSLPGLTDVILHSGQELALDDRYNMFLSKAIADWSVGTTWDMGTVPGASDDVEIAPTFAVTISTAAVPALSVTIDEGATGGLTLSGAGTLLVGTGGLTNSNTLGVGLNVTTGSNAVTITGGDLTNNGKITNAGTITVK
jgi:hypothetical protein